MTKKQYRINVKDIIGVWAPFDSESYTEDCLFLAKHEIDFTIEFQTVTEKTVDIEEYKAGA